VRSATELLNAQFGTHDLVGFGCAHMEPGVAAAGCLLRYARETQRGELPHVSALVPDSREDAVALDAASLRNLEIDTNFTGGDEYTLAWVLDTTKTAMGSRWLQALAAPPAAPTGGARGAPGRDRRTRRRRALPRAARGAGGGRRHRTHPGARGVALGAPARSQPPRRRAREPARAARRLRRRSRHHSAGNCSRQ
jgi:hypothetical protein